MMLVCFPSGASWTRTRSPGRRPARPSSRRSTGTTGSAAGADGHSLAEPGRARPRLHGLRRDSLPANLTGRDRARRAERPAPSCPLTAPSPRDPPCDRGLSRAGETAEHAVEREIAEECGIAATDLIRGLTALAVPALTDARLHRDIRGWRGPCRWRRGRGPRAAPTPAPGSIARRLIEGFADRSVPETLADQDKGDPVRGHLLLENDDLPDLA